MNPITLYLPVGPDIKLLEANLDYYSILGVSQILLSVHLRDEWADGLLEKISQTIKNYPAEIAQIYHGMSIDNRSRYIDVTREHCKENDWVVIADLDEFHEFSMPLPDVISLCESQNYDYVTGRFLDRVGFNGKLTEYTGNIWDCFPIGIRLTKKIYSSDSDEPKVVLARAKIGIAEGHHYALEGMPCPVNECTATVHHFKWDASVLVRAKHMFKVLADAGDDWCIEYLQLLAYFEKNNGCICIDDKTLDAYWPGYMRSECRTRMGLHEIHKDPNFVKPVISSIESVSYPDDHQISIRMIDGTVKYINSAAAILMELCNGERTVREISQLLMSGFPDTWHSIEKEIQDTLRKLQQDKLIDIIPDTSESAATFSVNEFNNQKSSLPTQPSVDTSQNSECMVAPETLVLDLSYHCNYSCITCRCPIISKSTGRPVLPESSALNAIKEFASLGGKEVLIFGGEPFLVPYLNNLVSTATNLGLNIGITTNGSAVTAKSAATLVEEGLTRIIVSIDGNEVGHDRVRGTGSFARTFEGLRHIITAKQLLRSSTPEVGVHITVSKHNIHHLVGLASRVSDLSSNVSISLSYLSHLTQAETLKMDALLSLTADGQKNHWCGFENSLLDIRSHDEILSAVKCIKKEASTKRIKLNVDPALEPGLLRTTLSGEGFKRTIVRSFRSPSVAIGPDGTLGSCPMLTHYNFATFPTTSLHSFFSSNRYMKRLRSHMTKSFLPICHRCCNHAELIVSGQ